VAGGTRRLNRVDRADEPQSGQPSPLPRDAPLPCSFAQERIWRSARTAQESAGFLIRSVTSLRGPIDVEALRAALEHGIARHEPLRTTFVERDGTPLQVIHPPGHLDLPVTDLTREPDPALTQSPDAESMATALVREDASAPLDLEQGPLLRFRLIRVSESEHLLLRVSHHLVTDRRSWHVFVTDAIEAYESVLNGRPLPPPDPLQYADFATWERQAMHHESDHCHEQVAWWRHAFDRVPPTLQLPFARETPTTGPSPEDGELLWELEPSLIDALDRVRRSEGAGRYTVRLAIFAALLALETGQNEVTIGTDIDNRRLAETESMFGDFSNLMTLILPFDPAAPLRSWLRKVRFMVTEARARADVPYELLCDELRAAECIPPEINTLFAFIPSLPELPCGEVELIPASPALVTMPWGFTFRMDERREGDRCMTLFDARLYDPAGVRRFIDRYVAFAEAATAHPDSPLSDLYAGLS
jgi:Condensation domain